MADPSSSNEAQQRQQFPVSLTPSLQIPIEIDLQNLIIEKLGNNIQNTMGITIQERKPLRKMYQNQNLEKTSKLVNVAFPNLIHRNAILTEINQLHYAAVLTIQN